jgi:outer membrane protein OmpA-like peptidoglycan-associated protein
MSNGLPAEAKPLNCMESRMIGRRAVVGLFGFLLLAGAAAPTLAATHKRAPHPSEYVVFFGAGDSSLSHLGTTVVASAAAEVKADLAKAPGSHVKVIGYSDTTGSKTGAQVLSEKRAATVREWLVQNGVDPHTITTEGRGKADLAVPTPDRKAEPRNRRARIVVYGPND